jgi:hypothetical protein
MGTKVIPAAVLLVALLALPGLAFPQSTEELAGQSAEQAGKLREALVHYVAALRPVDEGSSDASRLREKIIAIALKLDPPPAIPEEAQRRMARGTVAIKTAQAPADFEAAAAEFLEARNQAPWWPDAYFNLGVVKEKQGAHGQAISAFQAYLLARPTAEDASAVKTRIYELEFLQEKAQKAAAAKRQADQAAAAANQQAEQEAARQAEAQRAMIASLATGTWCEKGQFNGFGAGCATGSGVVNVGGRQVAISLATISMSVSGNQITISLDWHNGSFSEEKGVIEGSNLRGTHTIRNPGARMFDSAAFTGSVSPDGRLITINTVEHQQYPKTYEYVRLR